MTCGLECPLPAPIISASRCLWGPQAKPTGEGLLMCRVAWGGSLEPARAVPGKPCGPGSWLRGSSPASERPLPTPTGGYFQDFSPRPHPPPPPPLTSTLTAKRGRFR